MVQATATKWKRIIFEIIEDLLYNRLSLLKEHCGDHDHVGPWATILHHIINNVRLLARDVARFFLVAPFCEHT